MDRKWTDEEIMAAQALFVEAKKFVERKRRPVQGESDLERESESGLSWGLLTAVDTTKHARPQTTAQHYLCGYLRMKNAEKTPVEMAGTKRSFYFYRAALLFVVRYQIKQVLREIANSRPPGNDEIDEKNYTELLRLVEVFDKYLPDPNHKRLPKLQNTTSVHLGEWTKTQQQLAKEKQEDELAPGPKKPMRQTNKKKGLSTLPPDWREQYWEKVKTSIYADAIAVIYCTGCRPGELQIGVEVSLDDGQNLVFKITGIKTHSGKYGQQQRVITESVKSAAAEHLKGIVERSPDRHICIQSDRKKLSDTMRCYSKAVWPEQKYVVSPYSFRHQKAADVKDALTEVEVAMVLGHRSDTTQSYYAGKRLAKSDNTVIGVLTSNEVQSKLKNTPYPSPPKQDSTASTDELHPAGLATQADPVFDIS